MYHTRAINHLKIAEDTIENTVMGTAIELFPVRDRLLIQLIYRAVSAVVYAILAVADRAVKS